MPVPFRVVDSPEITRNFEDLDGRVARLDATAASLNTRVSALESPHRFQIERTTSQTIPNGSGAWIDFTTNLFSNGATVDLTNDVVTLTKGLWLITLRVWWPPFAADTNYAIGVLAPNGARYLLQGLNLDFANRDPMTTTGLLYSSQTTWQIKGFVVHSNNSSQQITKAIMTGVRLWSG